MPLIGFKAAFAEALETGRKCMTIRKVRKKGNPEVRDALRLYVSLRTKKARLVRVVKCTAVRPITIFWDGVVVVDGRKLRTYEALHLARADGFNTRDEFIQFFKKTHMPFKGCQDGFEGNIIEWDPV